jgi:hypothetical protein
MSSHKVPKDISVKRITLVVSAAYLTLEGVLKPSIDLVFNKATGRATSNDLRVQSLQ